jgi:Family of unknown function (DUF6171)
MPVNFLVAETIHYVVEAEDGEAAIACRKQGAGTVLPEHTSWRANTWNPELPSVATQSRNLIGAAGKALMNPTPVSKEEQERRLRICHQCEFLIDGKRCQKCGCTVKWKALLEAWHCPISKW